MQINLEHFFWSNFVCCMKRENEEDIIALSLEVFFSPDKDWKKSI